MQSSQQAMPACTAVGLHGTKRELSVNVSKTLTSLSRDNSMPKGKSVLVQQGLEEGICWAPFPLCVEGCFSSPGLNFISESFFSLFLLSFSSFFLFSFFFFSTVLCVSLTTPSICFSRVLQLDKRKLVGIFKIWGEQLFCI